MFLWAYFGFIFSAILLWIIIIRVTKDEYGPDWWDAARWIAGAYLAAFAVRLIAMAIGLPEVIALVLYVIVGLTVLDLTLKGQYGGEQAIRIVLIYVVVRVIFAVPWVLMWYLSRN